GRREWRPRSVCAGGRAGCGCAAVARASRSSAAAVEPGDPALALQPHRHQFVIQPNSNRRKSAMNGTLKAIAIACLLLTAQSAFAQPDFTELVEESIPAVVNIETTRFGTRPDETGGEAQRMPEGMPEFFRRFF